MKLRIVGALAAGALIAGVGVGVSSGLVTTDSIPHNNPTIAVEPHTKLVDLQKVLVVGSDFSANAFLGSVECVSNAVDESSCDLSTLVYANANGAGAVVLHRFVRRIINVSGTTVDCAAPNACALGVGNIADLTEAASAPIRFDAKVPPIVTKITAVPSTKLRDHELVKVEGQGFSPGSSVQVVECATAGSFECAYETTRYAVANNQGALAIPNYAIESQFIAFGDTGIVTIDCRAPHSCVLEAQTDGNGNTVNARLNFDPSIPPAISAITVTPATNLGDLQLVNVNGYGFLPGTQVFVAECTTLTSACDPGSTTVTAGFQGQFKITMAVHRNIGGQGPLGVVTTDCASHVGTCAISAQAQNSFSAPSVALAFNTNKPPVATTMTIAPHSDLVDNQRVGVTLNGFAPYRSIAVVECSAEAVAEQNLSYCDSTTEAVTTSPAGGGAPSLAFFVHRQIAGQNGLIDCAAQPGACVLIATPYQYFGYIGGGVTTPTTVATTGLAHSAAADGALPAPSLTGKPVHAAAGSSIPGIAIASLNFRS